MNLILAARLFAVWECPFGIWLLKIFWHIIKNLPKSVDLHICLSSKDRIFFKSDFSAACYFSFCCSLQFVYKNDSGQMQTCNGILVILADAGTSSYHHISET
jgi:hypothetical protein